MFFNHNGHEGFFTMGTMAFEGIKMRLMRLPFEGHNDAPLARARQNFRAAGTFPLCPLKGTHSKSHCVHCEKPLVSIVVN
jgi:hypothetical protein